MFYTHGETMDGGKEANVVGGKIGTGDESNLVDAYKQTFDLVDSDKSGTLEKDELESWLGMCGSELDLSKITAVLLKQGRITRDRFAELMSSSASSSRRDYDIGGSIGKSQH